MTQNNVNSILETWNPFAGSLEKEKDGMTFISGSTIALFASPAALYTDLEGKADKVKIIGITQDWDMTQSKQAPTVFECGSDGRYTIPTGRTAGQLRFARILLNKKNILFITHALVEVTRRPKESPAGYAFNTEKSEGFLINLASSLFNSPVGIIMGIKDINGDWVISGFFENCYILAHAMGGSAGAPYIGENVTMSFENVVPINMNALVNDIPIPPNS